MNNTKKITEESARKDFIRVMVFNLIHKINYFFRGDYRAFWYAKEEYIHWLELCRVNGSQDKAYTHKVIHNLERFDRCGLSSKAVKAIFHDIPNYPRIIEKYLATPHGRFNKGGTDFIYRNVYCPDTLDKLAKIFDNTKNLNLRKVLRGNFYTKRQKNIIHKYVFEDTKVRKPDGTIVWVPKKKDDNQSNEYHYEKEDFLEPGQTEEEMMEMVKSLLDEDEKEAV